jgi:hypothetical protein
MNGLPKVKFVICDSGLAVIAGAAVVALVVEPHRRLEPRKFQQPNRE